jgi:DNA anti-recombination protein RmuC
MASANVKQPCSKCDEGFGRNICGGCQQWFCKTHYNEHQEELGKEMNNVSQKHDELHSHLTMDNMDSENPLLVRINKWEQQSINRIRAVANEARTKLKQSFDQIKEETKASLSQVTNELKLSRTSEDYTEIELKLWMDQLESLKQQLENSTQLDLYGDTDDYMNASVIPLIELKAHQASSKLMRISPFIV